MLCYREARWVAGAWGGGPGGGGNANADWEVRVGFPEEEITNLHFKRKDLARQRGKKGIPFSVNHMGGGE